MRPISASFGFLPWAAKEKQAADNAEVTNRGAFAPFAEYSDGQVHPAWPGAFLQLGQPIEGAVSDDPEVVGRDAFMTGLGLMGAGSLFGRAPKGSLRSNSANDFDDIPWDLPDASAANRVDLFDTPFQPSTPAIGKGKPERMRAKDGTPYPETVDEQIGLLKGLQDERGGAFINMDDFRRAEPIAPGMTDVGNMLPPPKRGSGHANKLKHSATKTRLDEARDRGLVMDDDGKPTNLWYNTSPSLRAFSEVMDDPVTFAADLHRYEAATSPKTNVRRNIAEALNAQQYISQGELPPFQDLQFIPGGKLNFLDNARQNPFPGQNASTEEMLDYYRKSIVRGPAKKVPHYHASLDGGGSGVRDYAPGEAGITANDSIMAKPELLNMRDKQGYNIEAYQPGSYYEASDAITQSGMRAEQTHGAAMSPTATQAAQWVGTQLPQHGSIAYMMPHDAILDDVIVTAAKYHGLHPLKFIEELRAGRVKMPMHLYSDTGVPFSPMGDTDEEERPSE